LIAPLLPNNLHLSFAQLLKELETTQPDVVLMDLRMPGKDGIETTKEVSKK
jgi:CheY-like chemotaxis protein